MGIYLPNMEMPKSCGKCFVGNREICVNGCPLIPIPPHGDLIDKETVKENLVEELQRNKEPFPYQSYYPSWNDAVMAMLSAPTIIPADDKDINVPNKEEGE